MEDGGRWDGWLAPKVWIPAVAIVGVAFLAAGIILGMNVLADSKQELVVQTCRVGEPGCESRQSVHWHADFALFIDGRQFDFNQDRFLSEENDELSATVHIHEPRTTVVHVHRSGTTWGEFFDSLGFKLTDKTLPNLGGPSCLELPSGERVCDGDGKTLKFVVNGVQADGISETDITDLDRVLVSYGSESAEDVMAKQWTQVSDEACIPSGRCMERGADPKEPCGKFGATTCQ